MNDDLRERALAAARAEADQKARERAEYKERVRQWEAELIAAAEAAGEEALGVRVPFSMYTVLHPDGGDTAERAAQASVEGVQVTFRLYWRRGDRPYWAVTRGNTVLVSLQPQTRDDTSYAWRLSHDLTSLGAAIQARIDSARGSGRA